MVHYESAEKGAKVYLLRNMLTFAALPVTESETFERAGAALGALEARVTIRVNRHRERHGNTCPVMERYDSVAAQGFQLPDLPEPSQTARPPRRLF